MSPPQKSAAKTVKNTSVCVILKLRHVTVTSTSPLCAPCCHLLSLSPVLSVSFSTKVQPKYNV